MSVVGPGVVSMLIFGLFTHMACGATYSLVPCVNRKALGGVGAVAANFIVKGASSVEHALFVLGLIVACSALCALAVRFSHEQKAEEYQLFQATLSERSSTHEQPALDPAS